MQPTQQSGLEIADLTVGQVLRRQLVTCLPDAEIAAVAYDLVSHGVHAAVVTPTDGSAPLILTAMDLVRSALTKSGRVRAIELTHEPASWLSSDSPLSNAVAMMSERYTHHLLVRDPVTQAAVGFLSSLDIASVLGGLPPELACPQAPETRPVAASKSLDETAVGSVARDPIVTCAADVSLREVARTMAEHGVHCVAVAGIEHPAEHLVWGLIEDIDLMAAAHTGALSQPAVRFAESSPVAVKLSDSLARAAKLMVEHDTSHLVVAGPAGLPARIVSTLDVVSNIAAGEALRRDMNHESN